MECLDDDHLFRVLEGALESHEVARVDAHIDVCERCRSLVVQLVRARSGDRSGSRPTLLRSSGTLEARGASGLITPDVGRRYALLDLLGEGGMGRVYRALDRVTGQTVALKCVRFGAPIAGLTPARPGHLEALAREFRTLATLRHPNIISVLDYGFDAARRPYFTMELLPDARPLLPLAGVAPRDVQVNLLVQLLGALGYLHRRGILHRDLKPSNLLLTDSPDGLQLKVLDFGLAADFNEEGRQRVAGTLAYMAPEVLRGHAASEVSDLYAVGLLAYEMLTGVHPFRGGRAAEKLIPRVLEQEPDLTLLPEALRPVIGQALSKLPERRPASAAVFLRAITSAAGVTIQGDAAPVRESYLTAARFIGRDAEFERLHHALDMAACGQGSAWLVGGESGVGKSRLLEELRGRALVDGVLAVRGQALPGGAAYHVWRSIFEVLALHVELSEEEAGVLSMVLPSLGALLGRAVAAPPALDTEALATRLRRVLRDVIARSREPLLLLLEDLQWADAESLALLAQVSADLDEAPLLLLASYRDDEAPRLPADLPAMQALRLARLDRPRIEALCEAMLGPAGRSPGLVDRVALETEGNTYFIVEVVRALAEESGGLDDIGRRGLPERILAGGVEQVLGRRLARVPAESRSLLRLAAVVGRELDLAVLSRCAHAVEAQVLACAEAGVLEMHEQLWRFGHDKLRERVIHEIDAADLGELHLRAARAIEAEHATSADFARFYPRLARHFARGRGGEGHRVPGSRG
jgi:hypothetical protein